jgi:hypothetical protein
MSPDEIQSFERAVLYGLVIGDAVTVQGFSFQRFRAPGSHKLLMKRVGAHRLDPGREYKIGEVMSAVSTALYLLQQDSKLKSEAS